MPFQKPQPFWWVKHLSQPFLDLNEDPLVLTNEDIVEAVAKIEAVNHPAILICNPELYENEEILDAVAKVVVFQCKKDEKRLVKLVFAKHADSGGRYPIKILNIKWDQIKRDQSESLGAFRKKLAAELNADPLEYYQKQYMDSEASSCSIEGIAASGEICDELYLQAAPDNIIRACIDGHLEEVRGQLQSDPDNLKEYLPSALEEAACSRFKNIEILKLLLEYAADHDGKRMKYYLPSALIAVCSERCNAKIVTILLEYAADLDLSNIKNYLPRALKVACLYQRDDVVKILLAYGAQLDVGIGDLLGETNGNHRATPLHVACSSGSISIVRLLLEAGANPRAIQCYRPIPGPPPGEKLVEYSALQVACLHRNMGIVQVLLESGDDVQMEEEDGNGNTLLHYALCDPQFCGRYNLVEMIVSRGADVAKANRDVVTPLHLASRGSDLPIVQLLVGKGANVNAVDKNGSSPLHLTGWRGGPSIIQFLLDKGANINVRDRRGCTPLLRFMVRQENASYLYRHGVAMYMRDSRGRTRLHRASAYNKCRKLAGNVDKFVLVKACYYMNNCLRDSLAVVEHLILNGADCNAQNLTGWSPFHVACVKGLESFAILMVQHGKADVNGLTASRESPLQLACFSGCLQLAALLIAHGAVVAHQDQEGRSPVQDALRNGHVSVVNLLVAHGATLSGIEQSQLKDSAFSFCSSWDRYHASNGGDKEDGLRSLELFLGCPKSNAMGNSVANSSCEVDEEAGITPSAALVNESQEDGTDPESKAKPNNEENNAANNAGPTSQNGNRPVWLFRTGVFFTSLGILFAILAILFRNA